MKLKAYPAYKDSGVEWLGHVPIQWVVDRLKHSMKSCKNGIWGDEPQNDENDIPCVRVADFNRNHLTVLLTEPTIRNVTKKEQSSRLLNKGNLLLEKSGGGENQPVGCVVLYEDTKPAVCSNFVAKIELADGMVPSFWRYLHATAYSIRLTVGSINQTSGIQNLDQDRYFNERSTFPSTAEQVSIARFLDHETSKLDNLIAKQEHLIELLQEKRQAIISIAVTKGLNADAKMKDSGVPWLGKVPVSWKVLQFRHMASIQNGSDYKHIENEDGDYPVIGSGGEFRRATDYIYDGVSVLLGRKGTIDKPLFIEGKFWVVDTMFYTIIKNIVIPKFVFNCAKIIPFDLLSTSTALPSMTQNDLKALYFALPPTIEEQNAITEYIDTQTEKIDTLIDKAKHSIELAKEHRTALISAAVTGKIDVREYV